MSAAKILLFVYQCFTGMSLSSPQCSAKSCCVKITSQYDNLQLGGMLSYNLNLLILYLIFYHRELIDQLSMSLDTLRSELKGSTDLQLRQEELISTLKEETALVCELELELKETKRKYRELKHINEEQNELINRLRKVRSVLSVLIKMGDI